MKREGLFVMLEREITEISVHIGPLMLCLCCVCKGIETVDEADFNMSDVSTSQRIVS